MLNSDTLSGVTSEGSGRPARGNWVLWTAMLCVIGGTLLFWAWNQRPRTPQLEPGWNAKVIVLAGGGERTRFEDPFGVAAHADGTIFVSDGLEMPRVRALFPNGRIADVAGGRPGFEDGPGQTAQFQTVSGLALAPDGSLYVADTGNNAIRRIAPDGLVSTVAGDGVAGYQDGAARQARFNGPIGVAVDRTGRVLVADTYNDRIRRIELDGTVATIGSSYIFNTPTGVASDANDRVYIADAGSGAVHVLDPAGDLTTLPAPYPEELVRPIGVAIGAAGEVYVTDERGRIVEIDGRGSTRIVAGASPGFADGHGADARFRRPSGVAVLGAGRLVVADTGNALIRLVTAASQLEFRPPPRPGIAPHFDAEAFGREPLLWPVAPMEGPHEIAGTMGEARGSDAGRLHAGVDVRIEEGTPVLAARAAVVSSPVSAGNFGSLNEWLRIGSITYVHIRAGRGRDEVPLDPSRFVGSYDTEGTLVGIRVKRGARFASGDTIASVNRFNHVHINVGWPGEELNPLAFRLLQFADRIPPTIARTGVTLLDDAGERLVRKIRGRLVVTGPVQIVVEAWDQADGNRPNRRLAPYALGYQVLHADGSPVDGFERPHETIRMDQLGPDADAHLIYAAGSGIPFYGGRTTRFLFTVTNTFQGGVASKGRWDAGQLAPGNYVVRVFARDSQRNSTSRDLPVTVESPGPGAAAIPLTTISKGGCATPWAGRRSATCR
ncbi:MAG: gluconolaconase [Acidobacteriota bacterium]|nr:gluconolaconase [Acidobacteriota bacterium]